MPNAHYFPSTLYTTLKTAFSRCGALQSPAELHGYLVGHQVTTYPMTRERWPQEALQYSQLALRPNEEECASLLALYDGTHTLFSSAAMAEPFLLPSGSATLEERVTAFGQWCQGFYIGFLLAHGPTPLPTYSDHVKEILHDMLIIAAVGLNDESATQEESEHHYFVLCHYVHLGIWNLYFSLRSPSYTPHAPSVKESTHHHPTLQ